MGFAPLGFDYPWDTLADIKAHAASHPDGLVDLSVGTPVDPTPQFIQDALAGAADAPAYPTTHGSPDLRAAICEWFARRRGVDSLTPAAVMPTIGSKELVGLLPSLLGLGAGSGVVHPHIAYPTYDVGARLAGAIPVPAAQVGEWAGRTDVRLVWVNSPSNPTGAVASTDELRNIVAAARRIGAVVVSDECYAELAWAEPYASTGVPSLLDPRVCGGSHGGLLVTYSLSKQSNLAGYRAALVAGDPQLVSALVEVRKQLGLIMPAPVQAAMAAALRDDAHVAVQRERYARRREVLWAAVSSAGFVVDQSEAGLYLWARPAGDVPPCPAAAPGAARDPVSAGLADAPAAQVVQWFADRGILVGPGWFYGQAGAGHVRIALTCTDVQVQEVARRLGRGPVA